MTSVVQDFIALVFNIHKPDCDSANLKKTCLSCGIERSRTKCSAQTVWMPPIVAKNAKETTGHTTNLMHQSIPAVPIPPPGNRGAFAQVVSPGGGAFAILSRPGGWALAYPGRSPGI